MQHQQTSPITATERALRDRASEHPCPKCGAKAGVRCRFLRPNITNPKLTVVEVRRNSCPERVEAAWRAHLAAEAKTS